MNSNGQQNFCGISVELVFYPTHKLLVTSTSLRVTKKQWNSTHLDARIQVLDRPNHSFVRVLHSDQLLRGEENGVAPLKQLLNIHLVSNCRE